MAIVFNIAMMLTLIRQICKSKKTNTIDRTRSGLLFKQMFGMTSLLFNLGITWLSFIFYIKQFGSNFSYFSYVFIILNGSQVCLQLLWGSQQGLTLINLNNGFFLSKGIFIFIYHFVIDLSKRQKPLRNTLRLTLSSKWSTKTTQSQLG